MFKFLYCMQFLLNVFHMSEFHKEFNMRSLIVPLIGFNELWHHLPSCNILDCIHVILNIACITLHNFDVIQKCNGRANK